MHLTQNFDVYGRLRAQNCDFLPLPVYTSMNQVFMILCTFKILKLTTFILQILCEIHPFDVHHLKDHNVQSSLKSFYRHC